jgi:thioesterase domain-containing protein
MNASATTIELERYLHDHIPLSRAMQVSVIDVQPDCVTLSAPLPPNINHRESVFGGSASAVAVLAAWSLVHTRLLAAALPSRLVIQRNSMQFTTPITGTFTARSSLTDEQRWERFTDMLKRKGKARISVSCTLDFAGREAGYFEGEFVAVDAPAN